MTKAKKLAVSLLVILPAYFVIRGMHSSPVDSRFWEVCFSPDGRQVATVSGGDYSEEMPRFGEVAVWEVKSGTLEWMAQQPTGLRAVAWSRAGDSIALGDLAGGSKLVNPTTGKTLVMLPPHSTRVNAIAISGDGRLIAAASFDTTVTLSDRLGNELDTLVLPSEKAVSVCISSDQSRVAVGAQKGRAYLFDLVNGKAATVVMAYQGAPMDKPAVDAIAFAPDARTFATGCQNNLKLWEVASGRLIRDFTGNFANITSLAFSPNGRKLASVDSNGMLALWNMETGDPIKTTQAHAGGSCSVSFSSDSLCLATVGRNDRTTKIWNATSLKLLTTIGVRGN